MATKKLSLNLLIIGHFTTSYMETRSSEINFSTRLGWLFHNIKKSNGKRYTSSEVAKATGISHDHCRKLRCGIRYNPTKEVIERLASFFGVKPGFFLDSSLTDLPSLYLTHEVTCFDHLPSSPGVFLLEQPFTDTNNHPQTTWVWPPSDFREDQNEFLTETHPVVTLFLKFEGLDYEHDPEADKKLRAFIRWVQKVLADYDSYVVQVFADKSSSHLYATFGTPLVQDNDTERAVAAAWQLQSAMQQFDFISQIQIGLAHGHIRAGAYSNTTRRTYGFLVEGVNVAARLMTEAAPGQILVSQSIVEAASSSYYFKFLGPARSSSRQEQIPVSQVLSPRTPSHQMHQLQQILASTLDGQMQFVWMEGVTGIGGKDHLLGEMVEYASQQGMRILVGACQSTSQAIIYYPWQQILRELLALDNEGTQEGRTESLGHQIQQLEAIIRNTDPDWLIRLPLLGDLLDIRIEDNPTILAFEPDMRQQALFDLIKEILQTWAKKQPLLIIFEDANWIDEASRAILLWLSRAQINAPILFILANHQSSNMDTGREQLWSELWEHSHSINQGELSPPAVIELVTRYLEGDVSPLALDLIQAQAQGNPLFTKELVDALKETGDLCRQEDGQWWLSESLFYALQQANCLTKQQGRWALLTGYSSLTSTPQLDLPDSIHNVVLARLDRLPESLKLTLKVASVIGRFFERDLLALAHPDRVEQTILQEQIDQLEKLDFIQARQSFPQPVYLFKHSITRESVYATLQEQEKRLLHRAVAEALEQYQPEANERLAYHFSHSNAIEKLTYYLELAARKARREYANETALAYYNQALAITENWRHRKGQINVLHILGRRDEERASLEILEANSEAPSYEINHLKGRYYEAISDYSRAQAAIECALVISRDENDLINEAQCLSDLGLIARKVGNYEQAKTWYQQALALLEHKQEYSQSEAQVLTKTLNGLGILCAHMGEFDQAQTCHKRALVLSQETGNRLEEAQAYNDLGSSYLYQRRMAEAEVCRRKAAEIQQAIGNLSGLGAALANLGQVMLHLGDYSRAMEYQQEALHIFQVLNDRWHQVNIWNDIGIFHLELGELSKAKETFKNALLICEDIGDQAGQAFVRANLGLVERDQGQLEEAEKTLTAGLALTSTCDDPNLKASLLNYLSTVYLRKGRLTEAILQAKASLTLRQEAKIQWSITDNMVILAAAYLAAEDDISQALDYATQAKALLEECGGDGPEFPHEDYFIIYGVLSAAGENHEAQAALQAAYNIVMKRAEKINDPVLRRSFLEIAIHRSIITEYERCFSIPSV